MPSPAGTASAHRDDDADDHAEAAGDEVLGDLAEVGHERLRHRDRRRQDVALHQHGDDLPDQQHDQRSDEQIAFTHGRRSDEA